MRSEHQSITFYDILGIAPDASDEDVKIAYRRLAKKMHPDAGGSTRHMRLLNRAYEALKTESNRTQYNLAIQHTQKVKPEAEPPLPTREESLQNEQQMVAKVKEGAKRTLLIGVLIFVLGIIITAIAHSVAGPSGSYIVMSGAILWGGIAIFRGWYSLLNPFHILHKALDKKGQKYNFLSEKGNEGVKAFTTIAACCFLATLGLVSISHATPSSTVPTSGPVPTSSSTSQSTSLNQTTPPLAPASTQDTNSYYITPSTTNVTPLNNTVQQHCGINQTGVYPECLSPPPHLHCSGIITGDYTSYSCNDQTGKLFCTGSIIGTIASNTCDRIKGAPYTCQNNTISTLISIDCTGTAYIDSSTLTQ